MLSLAIIVPAAGRQTDLDETLLSILEERPPHCEILVPHPPAYRDPYALADELTFIPTEAEDHLELCNAGFRAARADVVHVLQPGLKVTPGWAESALDQLSGRVDAVSPAIVDVTSSHKASTVGVRYRLGGLCKTLRPGRHTPRIPAIDAPCLEAGFFRRSALESLGGLDATLGMYFGTADLAAKMRRSGLKCVHNPDSVILGTIAARPVGFTASRQMERVYRRHARDSNRLISEIAHALAVVSNIARQLPAFSALTSSMGHVCGAIECLLRPARCRWTPPTAYDDAQLRATLSFPTAVTQPPDAQPRSLRRSA